jgi:hypothetical protein
MIPIKKSNPIKIVMPAEWSKILGGLDFDIYEEEDVLESSMNIFEQEPD